MELSGALVQQKIIDALVNKAGQRIYDIIINTINDKIKEYYEEYEPSIYPRTGDLYKTAIQLEPIIAGNTVTFRVEFDSSVLRQTPWGNNGRHGVHHSYGVNNLDELLTAILRTSDHGGAFCSGRDIIEEVINDAKMMADIRAAIISGMQANGFICK